jgi:DivIVA domain-containing protein
MEIDDPQSVGRSNFSLTEGGYDPEEVDRFLAQLEQGLSDLKRKLNVKTEPVPVTSGRQAQRIEPMEDELAQVRAQALRDYRSIIEGARREADEMIKTAALQAQQLHEEADQLLNDHFQLGREGAGALSERVSEIEASLDQLLLSLRSGWLRSVCERFHIEASRFAADTRRS